MKPLRALTSLTVVASLSGIASAVPPSYDVHFLGEGYTGSGINQLGTVVGNLTVDGTRILAGVSHDGAPFELLPLPPGMETSRAHDINDDGVIVGAVCPNQYVITQPLAARWRPVAQGYEVDLLGLLPGDLYSSAWAINNLGDIVGGSGYFGWNLSHPVLFTDTGPVLLTGIGHVSDINDLRHVLSGPQLLDLHTMQVQTFSLPPGNWQGFGSAALNNFDDFAGYIAGFSGCSTFPMRYRQGQGWTYLGGCGTTTSATAINDRGDTLFYYYFASSSVYFEDEGPFGIGSLIHPSQGSWLIDWSGASAINNARQIVAYGHNQTTNARGAVLLTPRYTLHAANLIGGAEATFTIVGGTASQYQYIAYSLRGLGSTFIPQLNVTLDLRQPVLLTSGRADANGDFAATVHVPRAASGRTVWFQGAEVNRTTAVMSDVVR